MAGFSIPGTGGAGELPMVEALSTGTGGAGELPMVEALNTCEVDESVVDTLIDREGTGELPRAVMWVEAPWPASETTVWRRPALARTKSRASVKDVICFFIGLFSVRIIPVRSGPVEQEPSECLLLSQH